MLDADQLAFSLKMLELFFLVTLQIAYTALIYRQNQFSIFSFLNLYSGFLANSVDPDQCRSRIYTVCYTMYDVLHNLAHIRVTCFHMLKIASDGNFYLLFGENY